MTTITTNAHLIGSSTARRIEWTKDTDRYGQRRFDCYADGNHLGSVTRTDTGYEAFRSGDGAEHTFSLTAYSVVDRPRAERVARQLGAACAWVMATTL